MLITYRYSNPNANNNGALAARTRVTLNSYIYANIRAIYITSMQINIIDAVKNSIFI